MLTVMARTEVDTPKGKEDKITAFIVSPDMPGFKVVEAALDKVGMKGTKTSILRLENVEVPANEYFGADWWWFASLLDSFGLWKDDFWSKLHRNCKILIRKSPVSCPHTLPIQTTPECFSSC